MSVVSSKMIQIKPVKRSKKLMKNYTKLNILDVFGSNFGF